MPGSIRVATLLALTWATAPTPVTAEGPSTETSADLGFLDAFDTLDEARWYVSDGWTNGAHQNCVWSRRALAVEGGALRLTLERRETTTAKGETRPYVCAEMQTRAAHGYGLYEARIVAAEGSGLNSAFFTYTGKPHHDEIDVEILGRDTTRFDANYYTKGEGDHAAKMPLPSDGAAAPIDYAFEWTQGRIRWFVNGRLVHEVSGADIPEAEQKLFFSLWNGGKGMASWLGPYDGSIATRTMVVEHVAFTPVGTRCLFPGSLSCSAEWRGW